MATPKKRTGKASQATRRANWKGSVPATTICPNCKEVTLTHTVCPACGWYKDGFASIKKQQENAPEVKEEVKVEEPKKTRKPRAKKAQAAEEKVVEAQVVEKTEEEKSEETTEEQA